MTDLFQSSKKLRTVFEGFVSVEELMASDCEEIPKKPGIYMILDDEASPGFLDESVGGHFKHRDPTVSSDELSENWVDDTCLLYVGKAGGGGSRSTLYKRVRDYMRFGKGKKVGHWGGRLIWQLKRHRELLVCWKEIEGKDPKDYEGRVIQKFKSEYGKRPFANLKD